MTRKIWLFLIHVPINVLHCSINSRVDRLVVFGNIGQGPLEIMFGSSGYLEKKVSSDI